MLSTEHSIQDFNEFMSNEIKGKIHSVETFGAVDGPGVRYILFVQGCPLRCLYCHNPDTWNINEGKIITSQQAFDDIKCYKNFIKNGGVTISGGEPLAQPEFIADIINKCKSIGLHTAIDTSGGVKLNICKNAVDSADLLLLDIKSIDNNVCLKLTGQTIDNALNILNYCEEINKPVWIRHVLVPGLTLEKNALEKLADYICKYECVKKVELLPFHKMGEYKWEQLNTKYELTNTPQPSAEQIKMAKDIFISRKLTI